MMMNTLTLSCLTITSSGPATMVSFTLSFSDSSINAVVVLATNVGLTIGAIIAAFLTSSLNGRCMFLVSATAM